MSSTITVTPGNDEMSFDLAEKHGLFVWLDVTLATHGACPSWLIREHPDVVMVNHRGEPDTAYAHPAFPRGA